MQFAKFRPCRVPAEILYGDVLSIDVEAAEFQVEAAAPSEAGNVKPGGWTPFAKAPPDAQKVFGGR